MTGFRIVIHESNGAGFDDQLLLLKKIFFKTAGQPPSVVEVMLIGTPVEFGHSGFAPAVDKCGHFFCCRVVGNDAEDKVCGNFFTHRWFKVRTIGIKGDFGFRIFGKCKFAYRMGKVNIAVSEEIISVIAEFYRQGIEFTAIFTTAIFIRCVIIFADIDIFAAFFQPIGNDLFMQSGRSYAHFDFAWITGCDIGDSVISFARFKGNGGAFSERIQCKEFRIGLAEAFPVIGESVPLRDTGMAAHAHTFFPECRLLADFGKAAQYPYTEFRRPAAGIIFNFDLFGGRDQYHIFGGPADAEFIFEEDGNGIADAVSFVTVEIDCIINLFPNALFRFEFGVSTDRN